MGFDTMTHQPTPHLLSSFPYFLALANMTDLMDHQSPNKEKFTQTIL